MDGNDQQVRLTSREQQLLADLERVTAQSDPHLDAWLRTARKRRAPMSAARQMVVAVVVLVVATALMLGTFTRWMWVAALASGVQAASMAAGIRAWRRRRAGPASHG